MLKAIGIMFVALVAISILGCGGLGLITGLIGGIVGLAGALIGGVVALVGGLFGLAVGLLGALAAFALPIIIVAAIVIGAMHLLSGL